MTTKTYLTVASHWNEPGVRQYASADRATAERKAAELVDELVADWARREHHRDAGAPPTVANGGGDWEATLAALQLARLIDYNGGEGEASEILSEWSPTGDALAVGQGFTRDIREAITALVADDDTTPADEKTGFPMVWIEEVDQLPAAFDPTTTVGGLALGELMTVFGYAEQFADDWIETSGDHFEPEETALAAQARNRVDQVRNTLAALWPVLALVRDAMKSADGALSGLDGQLYGLQHFAPTVDDESIQHARQEGTEAGHFIAKARAALNCLALHGPAEPQPVRVLIAVDGGLVQGGCADAPVDITIVDYDTEGADPADLVLVPQDNGRMVEASVSGQTFTIDPAFIDGALAAKPVDQDEEGNDHG